MMPADSPPARPRVWVAPVVTELPPLTHLTLQSGGGGTGDAIGGSGGSGGLVF